MKPKRAARSYKPARRIPKTPAAKRAHFSSHPRPSAINYRRRKPKLPDEPLMITSHQQQRQNIALHSQRMTQDENTILEFLTDHCQGAANKITIGKLNAQLFPERRMARRIRMIVNNLRLLRWKIGSSSNLRDPGIFICKSVRELNQTTRTILTHVIAELRTVEALTGQGHYSLELCKRVVRL